MLGRGTGTLTVDVMGMHVGGISGGHWLVAVRGQELMLNGLEHLLPIPTGAEMDRWKKRWYGGTRDGVKGEETKMHKTFCRHVHRQGEWHGVNDGAIIEKEYLPCCYYCSARATWFITLNSSIIYLTLYCHCNFFYTSFWVRDLCENDASLTPSTFYSSHVKTHCFSCHLPTKLT